MVRWLSIYMCDHACATAAAIPNPSWYIHTRQPYIPTLLIPGACLLACLLQRGEPRHVRHDVPAEHARGRQGEARVREARRVRLRSRRDDILQRREGSEGEGQKLARGGGRDGPGDGLGPQGFRGITSYLFGLSCACGAGRCRRDFGVVVWGPRAWLFVGV